MLLFIAIPGCSGDGDTSLPGGTADANATSFPESATEAIDWLPPPEGAEIGPYPLPSQNPADLIPFMNRLVLEDPRGATDEARMRDLQDRMSARIAAADVILSKSQDPVRRQDAIRIKAESLQLLTRLGDTSAVADLAAFSQELQRDTDPALARIGRVAQFQVAVAEWVSTADADALVGLRVRISEILDDEAAHLDWFLAIQDVVALADSLGFASEAAAIAEQLLVAYAEVDSAELEPLVASLRQQLPLQTLHSRTVAFLGGDRDIEPQLMESVDRAVKTGSPETLASVLTVGQQLEAAAHTALAAKVYAEVRTYLPQNADPWGKRLREALGRADTRLQLLGEPIRLEGTDLSGNAFDWDRYRGKLVVVDFWASWSPECRDELLALRAVYESWHPQGLEVVGVCLDHELSQAQAFLTEHAIPWANLVSETQSASVPNPNAARYGIELLPFLILVDGDGRVVATHLRSSFVEQRVSETITRMSAESSEDLEIELEPSADAAFP